MKNTWQMMTEEISKGAAKGISDGLRGFLSRSVTITGLIIMLTGSGTANYYLFKTNTADRQAHKAEVKEYSDALKQANRMMIEAQAERQICLSEVARLSAELSELRADLRILKQKR